MSRMSRAGKTGLSLGAAVGVLAAGAAVSLAAERYAVGRSLRKADSRVDGPWRGESYESIEEIVTSDDGIRLVTDVHGDPQSEAVVILAHGYALNRFSWWYQWRDLPAHLGPNFRFVRYDQRGHGESEFGEIESIDDLAEDLYCVIEHHASRGEDIYLVGHSMGGMTIQAFAKRFPDIFSERVRGVTLVSSTPGPLPDSPLGLPILDIPVINNFAPQIVDFLASKSELVDRSLRLGKDFGFVLTKRYSFSSQVDPRLVEFVSEMIRQTPFETLAYYFPLFGEFNGRPAMKAMSKIPTTILAGTNDRLTPVDHARYMSEKIKGSSYIEAAKTGHLMMLERPDLVTDAIVDLVRADR
jgi:pimeloyl-ACP methyl ester carboxylesterase